MVITKYIFTFVDTKLIIFRQEVIYWPHEFFLDWLVFNANFSNISHEQILVLNLDTYKIRRNKK